MTPKFKPGDTVTWTSQAQGSHVTKTGEVLAIVPNGKSAYRLMPKDTLDAGGNPPYTRMGFSDVSLRDRYLVRVPGKTDKAKPRYYAPNVAVVDRQAK